MSALLASLFPEEVRVAGGPPGAATGALFPEEEAIVAKAVAKRRKEFEAGRLFAREALAELGVAPAPILAQERRPVWPADTLGTIAHTKGRCGAAVAHARDLAGIGLDVEARASVTEEMLRHVLTPAEREWLDSRPVADRAAGATLVFSAKESFYKSLAELREGFVGFHEVRIEPREAQDAAPGGPGGSEGPGGSISAGAGRFTVLAVSDAMVEALEPLEVCGRFVLDDAWLWTGVTLRVRA